MAKLTWDQIGARYYETGIDRGVLYASGEKAVPWNGLISVMEKPSGGDVKSYYVDGVKYLQTSAVNEEFEATITAYTYPPEFSKCDGTNQIRSGLFLTHQRRTSFGLSYRTMIDNDASVKGYKLHLVYDALVKPSQVERKSIGSSVDPVNFSWDIVTRAPAITGYKRTAHVVIDTRYASTTTISDVETILYGSPSQAARLPSLDELLVIFDTNAALKVIDHGNGTFTVIGPDDAVVMTGATTFEITWPTVTIIDSNTYSIAQG